VTYRERTRSVYEYTKTLGEALRWFIPRPRSSINFSKYHESKQTYFLLDSRAACPVYLNTLTEANMEGIS